MSNLIHEGIQKIEALLHPEPRKSYIARFCIHITSSSLLLTICIIYLCLTYTESRRTGRPLALLRVQRVPSGRLIVVNALVLLVLFNAVAALLMLTHRCKMYTIYYSGKIPFNRLVLAITSWLPLALVAWAYSFGNIAAMMQIKTRDYGGPSQIAIIAYNTAFIATLVAIFGIALPCCIVANMKMNRLLQLARDLLILLQEKSTSSSISSSEISAFQNSQTSIVMLRDTALMLIRFTLGVAAAISLLTAISAASAFWFVAFLSKLPNQERVESGIRSPSPSNPFEQDHEITFLGLGASPVERPSTSGRTSKSPSTVTQRSQNIALKRLHKDLRLSVPIVMILAIYCTVVSILTAFHLGDPKWKELTDDGLAWIAPVLIIIVVAFLHNLIRYRHSTAPKSTFPRQTFHQQAIQLSGSSSVSPQRPFFDPFQLEQAKVEYLDNKDEHHEGEDEEERQDKLQAKKEEKCSSAGLSMPIDIVMERARCHLDGSDYATMAIDTMEGRLLSLA